jgi:transcriptional regulator
MYTPSNFKNDNIEQVKEFIRQNSFGILVSQVNANLWATHIPLELDTNEIGKEVLFGHVSKANPQWKNFTEGTKVLAIFSGAHGYISSSWYDHENVPTWNYIAAHVYGKIKIIEGEKLVNSLKKLVDKFESDSEKPVSVEGMSEKYFNAQLNGLVGFEIEIDNIQASYKLSQNRDAKNHQNIVAELEKKGDEASKELALEMKKHCPR